MKGDDPNTPPLIAVIPCGPHDLKRFCLLWASLLETRNPFSEIRIAAPSGSLCVTLDADVLLWRPLASKHIRTPEGLPRVFEERPSMHPEWYASAARILGLPELPCSHWVTPCPLDGGIAQRLLRHLRKRLGPLWRWRLLNSRRSWTEVVSGLRALRPEWAAQSDDLMARAAG